MEILVIGTEEQATESRQKFGEKHLIRCVTRFDQADSIKQGAGVVFDFDTAQDAHQPARYPAFEVPLFFDSSVVRLADITKRVGPLKNPVFGFCGLRTFMNREILEVAIRSEGDKPLLRSICDQLGTDYRVVADQAGMVTPRVICMIINEAYYTLEEGTATREDIDLAMKLGTNYPWGPFDWGERIGLKNVVKVLEAATLETGDVRYRVCDLLQQSAQH